MLTTRWIPACFGLGLTFFGLTFALGQSTIRGTIRLEESTQGEILVWAMPGIEGTGNRWRVPGKPDIFAAARKPDATVVDPDGGFQLTVGPAPHAVFAFQDINGNGGWDPGLPEPFGWYADQAAGRPALIDATAATDAVDLVLKRPHPFPKESSQTIDGGQLIRIKGYPVLHLEGNARQRGFAHGKLLAAQIVDFFRFYILEDKFGSAKTYQNGFAKFLHTHFQYPPAMVQECEAVLEGMQASGVDLHVPELGRPFTLTDLYAINGYIETRAMRSSCTQFAAWGQRTTDTDVAGGMITGRNMDGEVDLRKVTVSHFVLMAVDPAEPGQKRFVSMMWPGFVATISGFNEEGFYTMENAGLTGPGDVVDQMVPFSWVMRESLAKLGADATPSDVQQLVDSFDNAAGGSCGPGCITLFAMPYQGQDQPAFILEGDRFGDAQRFAGQALPEIPQVLLGSNHHRRYGVESTDPDRIFGKPAGFSSAWRYEAGRHRMEGWFRSGRNIGTAEMRDLLQTVAHGTTEYAIITRPNQRQFDVAIASMESEPWDAPYREWTTFSFDELFQNTSR